MRVAILGPLHLQHDGRPIDLGGARLRALLARLAIAGGKPVAAATLADAVWDGELPADETHALQSLVSRLRRALGDAAVIEQQTGGYRLLLDAGALDAARFEALVAQAAAARRAGDAAAAHERLTEALALWRGPALGDLARGAALAGEAARLEDLRVSATVDRVDAEITLGRAAEQVAELEALLAEHPLHERIAALLIRALYAAGRQADALGAYEHVRVRLADELGVTPSPELQAAHLAVLQDEPAQTLGADGNLRAPLTAFVGRERELARIGQLLAAQRLVTIVGPGGAGKTRLSGEAAGRVEQRPRHGVWLVELASVGEPAGIEAMLLGSLGLREVQLIERKGGASTVGALHEVLADKQILIVLDNCEHLLDGIAELTESLLATCPGVKILATSREPLGIVGEHLVPLAPLDTATAVALFADRATAASPTFGLDAESERLVTEICARVDGLPLAIELAAARLRSMTLAQLAERLDDRFKVLIGGSRAELGRQRTLRAVVDWSWDLLEDPERAVARRLAVFAGGATAGAAEAVCAGVDVAEHEVFDVLCALVDKSIAQIVNPDSPRYRMSETVREYGLERAAEAGDLAPTRDAHAEYFAALAAEAAPHMRRGDQLEWVARLSAERDNVLAALRHLGESGQAGPALRLVVTLVWFLVLSGNRQEITAWIEFARRLEGDADPLDRLLVDGLHALIHAGDDNADGPRMTLQEASAMLDGADLSDYPLLAAARPMMGLFEGPDTVLELLERSEAHPDPWVRATAPFIRVQLYDNTGDRAGMRAALEEAQRLFGELGERWGLAVTLAELSGLRMLDGDLGGAEEALERTAALMRELGAGTEDSMFSIRRAELLARRGDPVAARDELLRFREAGDFGPEQRGIADGLLALHTWRAGDRDEARALVQSAVAQVRRTRKWQHLGHDHESAVVHTCAAWIALQDGDTERAEEVLPGAYAASIASRDLPLTGMVGTVVAELALRRARPVDAAELLGAAAQLRGSPDETNPEIAQLTGALRSALGEEAFAAAYGRGEALDQRLALDRVDPALLRAPAVGA